MVLKKPNARLQSGEKQVAATNIPDQRSTAVAKQVSLAGGYQNIDAYEFDGSVACRNKKNGKPNSVWL
jgi:hypothetical protein